MSIPIIFRAYDVNGSYLKTIRPFTMSYGSDTNNLTVIGKTLFENVDLIRKTEGSYIKYLSPVQHIDYMFDLDTGNLLPNNFEHES